MDIFTLWENNTFTISTPKNPHLSYNEGLHIAVAPKRGMESAWSDIALSTETFKLATQACKIMAELKLAPWFNIQANGNWGLLSGKTSFHVHILGRNKTNSWGKPVVLPELPGTYHNEPMPEINRNRLIEALKSALPSSES